RGLPPELITEISFEDENKNKIFEANEYAIIKIKLENKGLGVAQGVYFDIKDKTGKGIEITNSKTSFFVYPNQIKEFEIPVIASIDLKTEKHYIEIEIKEYFGYDANPVQLYVQTLEYQSPNLVFSGFEVLDYGEGVMSVVEDGKVQPGELVKVKLYVQNIGLNVARQSEFEVYTNDVNIYLANQDGALGNFEIGEVKEIEFKMSPNKRINLNEPLDLYLNLTENSGNGSLADFKLPIEINKQPKMAEIIDVAANIDELKTQVKKFELYNKSFKTNYGELVDIFNVQKREVNRENSIGVIIGVEEYLNLPPAPYAVNDAMIIEKYFKDLLGINEIVFLTNKDVTGLAFDDIFNPEYGELQKSIIRNETELFVFYSGHGIPNKSGTDVYLFPQDGKIERVELQGYSLGKFYNSLNSMGAKRVIVFLDACFSGVSKTSETVKTNNLVSMKGVRLVPQIPKPWEKNDNFVVFNSSSFNETSLAFDETQTGLFTYYLCAGLSGKADTNIDNQISLGELKKYVIENVMQTSKKIFGLQTPEFHGDEDYIISDY
ncbi:MAG: caspase family protein, partial [Bacteroidales bacterium]|nr:caspase family protein [Bacteroidales bacterium]